MFGWDTSVVILGVSGSAAEEYAETYGLTFHDTTASEMIYRFRKGQTVQLTAVPDPGYHFVRWESSTAGVEFSDPNSATTTFVMPAAEVSITAIFEADEPAET